MDDSTYEWRKHQLVRAGYTEAQAEVLAEGRCDLHEACELVTREGCPADIAFDIFAEDMSEVRRD